MNLDYDVIYQTITITAAHFDVDLVVNMVSAAVDRWAEQDEQRLTVYGVEEQVDLTFDDWGGDIASPPGLLRRVKAILDLQALDNVGRGVIDWKTTNGEYDQIKRDRHANSWQWKIYTVATGAEWFEYRTITRAGKCYELRLTPSVSTEYEVREYLEQVWGFRDTLIASRALVWPRNMPGACGAWGRTCQYKTECINYSMPRQAIEPKDLSYSEAEQFLLCPEKTRRRILDKQAGKREDTEETSLGVAFHAAMAEVYRQIYNLT